MLKLRSSRPYDFPTSELLKITNELSVHQLIAYHSLLQINKTLISKKPSYIYKKLQVRTPVEEFIFPKRETHTIAINRKLNASRSSFLYRGASLFNKLPQKLRECQNEKDFKREVKSWVKANITIKPV